MAAAFYCPYSSSPYPSWRAETGEPSEGWYKPPISDQQRDHVKRHVSSFKRWKEKNLGEHHCHTIAATVARKEFHLSEDKQREVDMWLDERYLARTKNVEREDDLPSVFDSLPRAW